MFGTEGANDKDGMTIPKFITVGPNELKIVKFDVAWSKNGKFKVLANLETKPVGGDFEGWEDAKGQVGRVDFSIYTDGKDGYQKQATDKIAIIANTMGIREEVDAIRGITKVDDYLAAITKIFKGKYAWFLVGGEEYQITDKEGKGRIKEKIQFPRYNYVAKTEAELRAKQTNDEFPDKHLDDWFFKKLEVMDNDIPETNRNVNGNSSKPIKTDDLPF